MVQIPFFTAIHLNVHTTATKYTNYAQWPSIFPSYTHCMKMHHARCMCYFVKNSKLVQSFRSIETEHFTGVEKSNFFSVRTIFFINELRICVHVYKNIQKLFNFISFDLACIHTIWTSTQWVMASIKIKLQTEKWNVCERKGERKSPEKSEWDLYVPRSIIIFYYIMAYLVSGYMYYL